MANLCASDGIVILDGAMGRLLQSRGVPEDTRIWSAISLVDEQHHAAVVNAHADYIRAGATLITTNNYGVQPTYYRRAFEDWETRIPQDAELAARLAVQARAECNAKSVRILGCLPPLVESHRPDLAAKFLEEEGREFCVQTYRSMAEGLLRGGADMFLAETMNNWEEAELAIEAVADLGLPVIVSLQGALLDKMTMKPQPRRAVEVAASLLAAKAAGAPIVSLSFNCAPPETILECLAAIQESPQGSALEDAGVALAAYANVSLAKHTIGEVQYDMSKTSTGVGSQTMTTLRADLKKNGYTKFCEDFVSHGARCVGGCCMTTPEDIKALAATLNTTSPRIRRKGA